MSRVNLNTIQESTMKLDALNQAIWETGFTIQTLTELSRIVQEIHHGTTLFERIPQAQQPGLSKGSSILTSAGIICRGCPGTESEVREIYHTDDLIGEGLIQERLVEVWAKIVGCWFESPELYFSSLSEMKDFGPGSYYYPQCHFPGFQFDGFGLWPQYARTVCRSCGAAVLCRNLSV